MTPGGKELRAVEFVLGALDEDDRQRVDMDMRHDKELRTYVDAWSQRLLPMTELVKAVAPSPTVWRRVEAAIGPVRAGAQAAPMPVRIWERISFWRWTTAGAALAAGLALIATVVSVTAPPTTVSVPRVAALSSTEAVPSWLVTLDANTRRVEARPAAGITVEAGRALELWLVPAGGGAPRSLGLLDADTPSSLTLDGEMVAMLEGAPALAISLEPSGGSPTGAPTGPVLYQGALLSP